MMMKYRVIWGICAIAVVGCASDKTTDSAVQPAPTGSTDTGFRDSDGDGFPDVADCGPADASVFPGAPEVCNRIDDDCDGIPDNNPIDPITVWSDTDGDGYGDPDTAHAACSAGSGEVTRAEDCDDQDAGVHPAAREVCWNGKDDDCDGDPGICGPSGSLTTAALTARWSGSSADALGTSTAWSLSPSGSGETVLVSGMPGTAGGGGGVAVIEAPLGPSDTIEAAWTGDGVDGVGAAVLAIGDATEDGYPDLLVGAPGAAGNHGAVLLLQGGPTSLSLSDHRLTGVRAGDRAGSALAAGDTDSDGLLDLAVGVPTEVSGGLRGGVAVVRGPLAALGRTTAEASAWISGRSPGGATGLSVALDGDVNGDGLADLVVGAPREGAGEVGIFFGPVSGSMALSDADRSYQSDGLAYEVGRSVAWAGDTDGDGTDDLLVTAPLGSLSGAVLVFYSADVVASDGALPSGSVGAAVLGTQYASGGVARIGDVSGDGLPDVFAGGPGVHWSPLAGGIDAEDADLWLVPETTESGRDVPGWLPAQVGPGADPDIDQDGHAEVIFAGPGLAPSGRTEAGEVQVLAPAGY